MTNTCILYNDIYNKFRHRQESCLVILLLNDKSTNNSLNYTILSFGLVVRLQIKGSSMLPFNTKK